MRQLTDTRDDQEEMKKHEMKGERLSLMRAKTRRHWVGPEGRGSDKVHCFWVARPSPEGGRVIHDGPFNQSKFWSPNIASQAERVDYYALLSIDRDASQEDITKAWRKLVLQHHPDKQRVSASTYSPVHVDIRLVNEAKWVLSDPTRRKEWEETFYDGQSRKSCTSFSAEIPGKGDVVIAKDQTPHISHHISLEFFTPHYPPTASTEETDEIEPSWYSHPCRCSGEFVITLEDLEEGVEIVGCGGCGEWVRVGYEAVEDDQDPV